MARATRYARDMDPKRELLRHTVATLAYRASKVLRDAPTGLAETRAAESSRSAIEILAHVNDVLEWARSIAAGEEAWRSESSEDWEREVQRFFDGLEALETFLAGDAPLASPEERLFQGPIADSLTHIGQIALLRRLAGTAVAGENYHRADIAAGRVGPDQVAPEREF